jgi:multiple sugar transport system ATP-binding protein
MGSITLKKFRRSFRRSQGHSFDRPRDQRRRVRRLRRPVGLRQVHAAALIAGLEDVTAADRHRRQGMSTAAIPAERGLAMVFQSYALYPHMSVRNNIAFPLKMAGMEPSPRSTEGQGRSARAEPHRLSRTQAAPALRRPAPARRHRPCDRAQPSAFLFDEPLSNLDAALRGNMRLEISELHHQLKTTMIYVTHDQVEAMTMADKIVVLNRRQYRAGGLAAGSLQQAAQSLRRRLHRLAEHELHRPAERCRRTKPIRSACALSTCSFRPKTVNGRARSVCRASRLRHLPARQSTVSAR